MKESASLKFINQYIAEFIGIFLLMFFGTACNASIKLMNLSFNPLEISIVWGMSVSMSIYLTSSISGAHLNPAVTIALWLFSDFERYKVIPYILFQLLGGFFAAALVYLIYYDFLTNYEHINNISRGSFASLDLASIFSTYPNSNISTIKAFFTEIITTAFLIYLILGLIDEKNGMKLGSLTPLLIGILISIIGAALGPLTGPALNPARDLGPKFFLFLAGWGMIAYTGGRDFPYFIIPMTAPIIGACLGASMYKIFLKINSYKINKKYFF